MSKELTTQDQLTEFLLYTAPNGKVKVEVILHNETIWLTQERMAELFGVQRPAITKHLKNIFDSGELQEEVVCSVLEHTTEHGAIAGLTQTQKTVSEGSLYGGLSNRCRKDAERMQKGNT